METNVRYLIEPLLTQFFLIDAICKGLLTEDARAEIFRQLAEVFCVPMNQQTQAYYTLANAGQYRAVTDYAAYERLCRTIEFAQTSGQDVGLTPEDQVILAQKREAMQIRQQLFKQSSNLTADTIADTLLTTALNGSVDAMATLSFMEYHGICICKDAAGAVKRLRLCAKWNHLFGNLMGIAYDPNNRQTYYNTLYTVLRSSNQREEFQSICQYGDYQDALVKDPVARILEKAFGLSIISRNQYDQLFAQVAFSQLISIEDKEKLLLNKKSEAIAALAEIPFDVKRNGKLCFDETAAQQVPLPREQELHEIFCSLSPVVSNRPALYRPLLVASEDGYVSNMYAQAVERGFAESGKVIRVDAGTLTLRDFVGTKENFILRGLSETKQSHTVFLLNHCQELGAQEMEELLKLLDYGYRRKFKLLEPTVSLDLSDVVIVLFATGRNDAVQVLAEACDTVWTQRISQQEKQTVIDTMFRQRATSFGCEGIQLEDDCVAYLEPFQTGQIVRLIDSALKKAAYDKETRITAAALKTICDQQNISRSKRQFGFLGGVANEQY